MSGKEDSRVIWLTCPDCGARIGVMFSVGKSGAPEASAVTPHDEAEAWPPQDGGGIEAQLRAAGVDVDLLNIEEGEEVTRVSPKKFLGDLWGPINDAVKPLGGVWVREGRDSRWEIRKQQQ